MEGICKVGSSKNDSATFAQWQMEKHTHTHTLTAARGQQKSLPRPVTHSQGISSYTCGTW